MKDIERWIPKRWDQIVGNRALKEYFWNMIWCVRKDGHRSGFNLLATGPSRTGKTSAISFGIKCLGSFGSVDGVLKGGEIALTYSASGRYAKNTRCANDCKAVRGGAWNGGRATEKW